VGALYSLVSQRDPSILDPLLYAADLSHTLSEEEVTSHQYAELLMTPIPMLMTQRLLQGLL